MKTSINSGTKMTLVVFGSLASVIFLAGAFYAKAQATADKVQALEVAADARDAKINQVSEDVAVIKSEVHMLYTGRRPR